MTLAPTLCIVVKGFPRVSETFITRELEGLEAAGLRFTIASLRVPAKEALLAKDHRVTAPVTRLPEYLHQAPMRVLRALKAARALPGFASAWQAWRADFARDPSRNRVRRFGQACVLVHEAPSETRHLHAHFIHTPASVARYASLLAGWTFSVSAHAKDIWTTPDWDLSDKAQAARFIATCNLAGYRRLMALGSVEARIHHWPHAFSMAPTAKRDGAGSGPLRLLTVARAVEKKGLEDCLKALAMLPPDPEWQWTHIGAGESLESLRALAANHPYRARLKLMGGRTHTEVLDTLAQSDIFILPARIAKDGDRDGRPNAVLEAMSAGLPCVATAVGGIPEIITHAQSGLIADGTIPALADAIGRLLRDPTMRDNIGKAARLRAQELSDDGQKGQTALANALREACEQ